MAKQTVIQTPGEEDGLVRLIIVRKSSPIEGHTRAVPLALTGEFGENADFLTKVEADRGVGRGRGVRPTQQTNPHQS